MISQFIIKQLFVEAVQDRVCTSKDLYTQKILLSYPQGILVLTFFKHLSVLNTNQAVVLLETASKSLSPERFSPVDSSNLNASQPFGQRLFSDYLILFFENQLELRTYQT